MLLSGHSVHDTTRGKMSTPSTLSLVNSVNGFRCVEVYHPNQNSGPSIRPVSRTRQVGVCTTKGFVLG